MAGGSMRNFFSQLVRLFVREARVLFVIALIAASLGLTRLHTSAVDLGEYTSPQQINVVQCVGWKEATSPIKQKILLANGNPNTKVGLVIEKAVSSINPFSYRGVAVKSGSAVQVTSEGEGAGSLSSTVLVSGKPDTTTGLAADACRAPSDDWWFTGIKTQSGYSARLLLSNPDNADAIVALTAFTPDGQAQIGGFRRVLIPANKVRVVDLTQVVPGADTVSVHVRAVEGRVTPSLQSEVLRGANRYGRTFIAPISEVTNTAVITGLRGNSVKQQLVVMPTVDDAIVTVKVHNAEGTFTVADGDSALLNKLQPHVFDIAGAVTGSDTSIEVVSDQPVIAAVRSFTKAGSSLDYEVQSSQTPISGSVISVITSNTVANVFEVFATEDSTLTVNAAIKGQISWTKTFEIAAGTHQRLKFDQKFVTDNVVTFTTTNSGLYVSHIMVAGTSAKPQSTVLGLVDPASQIVEGVRLHLLVS
jgi:hypothetical protein